MTDFLLIPGADGRSWYWHLLVAELEHRGHRVVAVDLPLDAEANLDDYAQAAVDQAGAAEVDRGWVVAAQSLGAFTAPLVCSRISVDQLVLLNPMVPSPGETAGDWWDNTGQDEARQQAARDDHRPADFDLVRDFFHDVPPEITEGAFADAEVAALDAVFAQPWPLTAWPDVSTRVIQATGDRFFPLEFQRRVVRDRLGIEQFELLPGGHLSALSHPIEVADALVR